MGARGQHAPGICCLGPCRITKGSGLRAYSRRGPLLGGTRPFQSLCLGFAAKRRGLNCCRASNTIKQVDSEGYIRNTPERSQLWGAQTPQGFALPALRAAHQRAAAEGWQVTDDAALFERLGLPVRVLEASSANLKITTPLDLELAAALLKRRQA